MSDSAILSYTDFSVCKDRGILKKIIREGQIDATPCPFDKVVVHFVGTYFGGERDGQTFYSTRAVCEPFKFSANSEKVIESWEIVVMTMKFGEICELILAPEYAYEDEQALKFEIELVDAYGYRTCYYMENVRNIRISRIFDNDKGENANAGFTATLNYRCLTDVNDKEGRDVTYVYGDPESAGIPDSIEKVLKQTPSGSIVRINEYMDGFDSLTHYKENMRKSIYIVELKSVECISKPNCDNSERFSMIETIKNKANQYFQLSKFGLALKLFERIFNELNHFQYETEEIKNAKISCKLKMALIKLKMNKTDESIQCYKLVLKMDAKNEKALFSLGEIQLTRHNYEEASQYFHRLIKINPNNKAAVNQLQSCKETLKRQGAKEKELFRKGFARARMVDVSERNNRQM